MRHELFDLNLLRALGALLEERNVSKAAKRLHVTQQAMSGSLRRLREHFNDELLVRVGRELRLSTLGSALLDPIHEINLGIIATLNTTSMFDSMRCERRFRMVMSDYVTLVLLPSLMQELARSAPHVVCDVEPLREGMFEDLEELGVHRSIVSISSPGVHFGDDKKSRELCRRINEYGADLKARYPGRFGYFASVPLPDVDSAIEESTFALDKLGAEGVIVQSNHHGLYLGDAKLEPFWAALDERKSIVFVHPTAPPAVNSERINQKIPQPVMEFFFDTSRSFVDLITSGVLQRYSRIKFIVPHAGAVLPILTNRIDTGLQMLTSHSGGAPIPTLHDAMRVLHFDLAGLPIPELLMGLLGLAEKARLHYGSDYPFTQAAVMQNLLEKLETTPLLDIKVKTAMFGANSRKLLAKSA